jgi:hypothetical protein
MQLNSLYLYPNKIEVFTNMQDQWVGERYRRVYNRNQKIYRGADNRIDFQVKNSSQKSFSISDFYLIFKLVTADGQKLVFSKDCELIPDDTVKNLKGRAYVIITREELWNLEPGFYQYSIIKQSRQYLEDETYSVISSSPTYVDSQYGSFSALEIFGDLSGEPQESILVKEFSYTNPKTLGEDSEKFQISSIIPADFQTTYSQDTHTFQFYFSEGYQGAVEIQASLDLDSDPKNWVTVNEFSPIQRSVYENVVGKYRWFRIKHTFESGTIDRILYR